MWLIETDSFALKFIEDATDQRYAILSHTWEDGEVDFKDMANISQAQGKPGFSKIAQTCQLAQRRGIKFAWVDTCCIDKSSSAELTEAINSMFHWYENAAVCFVYLSDLPSSGHRNVMKDDFPRCKWFTRGWTLQELIAPKNIEFHDKDWNPIGDKVSLQQQLSKITRVDIGVLENSDLLPSIPVARRMSWAAKRRTTRVEDCSYSLFGIFGVNLPLIYGEGWKAFIRLQEAIASDNNDLSLFAWTSQEQDQDFRGIFARSPSEFWRCDSLQRNTEPAIPREAFTMTNKGVHITTRLGRGAEVNEDYQLNLHCFDSSIQQSDGSHGTIVIRLLRRAHDYVRCSSNRLVVISYADIPPSTVVPVYIPKVISPTESRLINSGVNRCFAVKTINACGFSLSYAPKPLHLWDSHAQNFITDGHEKFTALLSFIIHCSKDDPEDINPRNGHQSRWEYESTPYIAILGLEKVYSITNGQVIDQQAVFRPWAAIYKPDDKEKVFEILSQEGSLGFPQVLTRISTLLRSRASGGRGLPTSVEIIPSWTKYGDSFRSWKISSVAIDKGFLQLEVSANVNSIVGRSMYEVVLKLTGHNLSTVTDLRLSAVPQE